MGVWWSRWYDLNNYDTRKVVADYESRDFPLDVFVIDMDWHTKDDWSVLPSVLAAFFWLHFFLA
jgi:alpha-glucosidase (family GH31 glycosyl hydrolase)